MDRTPRVRAALRRLGIECLDREWSGWGASYRFRCHMGHEFHRTMSGATDVKALGCPQCNKPAKSGPRSNPLGLTRLRDAAAKLGGECLSDSWATTSSRYRFRCSLGHEWDIPGNEVLRGKWCRKCANMKRAQDAIHKEGIGRLKRIAHERGGECLSEKYTGVSGNTASGVPRGMSGMV